MPIKTQDVIQKFFIENDGKEFIGFDQNEFIYGDRVYYRYFFQEKIGKNRNTLAKIQNKLISVQRILKCKRNSNIKFQKGSNWFSITDQLARYIVSKQDWIKRIFKDTCCADEVFLQTVVINSEFYDRLYYNAYNNPLKQTMRLVDWKRGKPYIFRTEDIDLLTHSGALFARKFDCDNDARVINEIEKLYSLNTCM